VETHTEDVDKKSGLAVSYSNLIFLHKVVEPREFVQNLIGKGIHENTFAVTEQHKFIDIGHRMNDSSQRKTILANRNIICLLVNQGQEITLSKHN
jgi:hypothetical protein